MLSIRCRAVSSMHSQQIEPSLSSLNVPAPQMKQASRVWSGVQSAGFSTVGNAAPAAAETVGDRTGQDEEEEGDQRQMWTR